METKVYSIFGKSGVMEEIKPVPVLPLYCKVYIYGFAMNSNMGAIISAPNQYGSYEVVEMAGSDPRFTTLDKYSRPHSKKFGIGIYYDDDLTTWPEGEVKKYVELAKQADIRRKDEAEKQARSDEKERAELPALFPYLTVNPRDDQNITANNIRADLKHHFPGVRFSVRKDHHSTYYVNWNNGPTESDVCKVVDKYEDHSTDITGDFRDYNPSNFNKVFGGFDYVFTSRNIEKSIFDVLLPQFEKIYNCEDWHKEQILGRILRQTAIPEGATNFNIIVDDSFICGSIEEGYKITFDLPEVTEVKAEAVISGDYKLIDYSDKAVALFGNTKPIRDTLKEIGGRFNPCLNVEGAKVAGWVFPKAKRDVLEQLIK